MEENQFLNTILYSGGALAAWIATLFALGVLIAMQRRYRERMLGLVPLIVLAATGLGAVMSGRDITSAEFDTMSTIGADTGAMTWMLRFATAAVLGICVARLISVSQGHEARVRTGFGLYAGLLLFYITNIVINNLLGTKPVFDQRTIYPVVVFTAVYFSRNRDQGYLIDGAKLGLLLFLLGSCAIAVLMPSIAVQADYDGVLKALNIRLWGLGSNPNSIGPLALLYMLLLAHRPYRHRLLQWLGMGLSLLVLLLAQSKTAWLATALVFGILWWGRLKARPTRPNANGYPMRRFAGPLLISDIGFAAMIGTIVAEEYSSYLMSLANQEQVTTLTGRTAIWDVAIKTWEGNPIFGYGSSMWDPAFREAIGMNFAFHAHNQFLQALSVAGIVGMIGLLVYLFLLARYSYQANRATRGLSMALFSMIFLRFFTEAPLDMTSIFSGEFVTHLLLFALILTKGRQSVAAAAPMNTYEMHQLQWR